MKFKEPYFPVECECQDNRCSEHHSIDECTDCPCCHKD